MLSHPIPPLYDEHSKILILGSFPSVKSREQQFFYGHKQNRFWRVMAQVLVCAVPETVEQKREMLLSHHIAVWDVIASCEITGSSDASIRDVTPNDLSKILECADIRAIYTNGGKAQQLYQKYIFPVTGRRRFPYPPPARPMQGILWNGSWRRGGRSGKHFERSASGDIYMK